jgi:hypothetical protein
MLEHDEWDGIERRKPQAGGFAVNSWPALAALTVVAVFGFGIISWGLKLEARIYKYADVQASMRERFLADLSTTQSILARGMLPVTEVKLQAFEKRMDNLEKEIDSCIRKNKVNGFPFQADKSP